MSADVSALLRERGCGYKMMLFPSQVMCSRLADWAHGTSTLLCTVPCKTRSVFENMTGKGDPEVTVSVTVTHRPDERISRAPADFSKDARHLGADHSDRNDSSPWAGNRNQKTDLWVLASYGKSFLLFLK